MAITFDNSKSRYTGLSTDDKTFLQVSGMNGVKIFYTDLLKTQIYDKNVGWVDDLINIGTINSILNTNVNNVVASSSTNGLTIYRLLSTATTNATSLKTSAGRLYSLKVSNLNSSSTRYLKLYNKSSAPLSTDIPVMTIPIASNTITPIEIILNNLGIYFSTGIAFAITGALADNDTTVIGANEVVINAMYI